MIYITGDTHRDFKRLNNLVDNEDDMLIVLGDAGINYFLNDDDKKLKGYLSSFNIKLFCIRGNHEERPENIDTYSATGRMFIKIIGIFAEFERENIVERVRLGLERKVKEGYTIASKNVSYGYTKDKGEKVQKVCEYEAYVIRKIFNMFVSNYSYTEIANYLNKFKIKTKNNKDWNYKIVKKILTNPNYIGKVRYGINKNNYFEIDGKHQPIVNKELFYMVQNKINNKKIIRCNCNNICVIKTNKYYSKKKNRKITYKEMYCNECKKHISVKKIYGKQVK